MGKRKNSKKTAGREQTTKETAASPGKAQPQTTSKRLSCTYDLSFSAEQKCKLIGQCLGQSGVFLDYDDLLRGASVGQQGIRSADQFCRLIERLVSIEFVQSGKPLPKRIPVDDAKMILTSEAFWQEIPIRSEASKRESLEKLARLVGSTIPTAAECRANARAKYAELTAEPYVYDMDADSDERFASFARHLAPLGKVVRIPDLPGYLVWKGPRCATLVASGMHFARKIAELKLSIVVVKRGEKNRTKLPIEETEAMLWNESFLSHIPPDEYRRYLYDDYCRRRASRGKRQQ